MPKSPAARFCMMLFVGLPAALAAAVLGLEVLVRLLGLAPSIDTSYSYFVADPVLPFKPKPLSTPPGGSIGGEFSFVHSHNSLGFRDGEHAIAKAPGVYRILGLGDSFTYGSGAPFEDTYLARLERLLNERPQPEPRIEIIKAGIPRYFPEAERLLLEHLGLGFKPDLVLTAFSPNDLPETYLGIDAVAPHPDYGFLMTKEARMLGPTGIWLFRHWHTFRVLWVHQVSDRMWFDPHTNPLSAPGQSGQALRVAWQRVQEEYTRMAELSRAAGARIVFLYIPAKGPPWPDEAARQLEQWCAARGLPFIDLLPAIRSASEKEELYWKKDMHCNAAGYRVIAEELARRLPEMGLVP